MIRVGHRVGAHECDYFVWGESSIGKTKENLADGVYQEYQPMIVEHACRTNQFLKVRGLAGTVLSAGVDQRGKGLLVHLCNS